MPFIKGTKTTYASPNTIRHQAVEIDNTAIIHDYADNPAIGAQAFELQVPEYKNYLVQILEFVIGNPIGTVIGSYVVDVRKDCSANREDIELVVDGGRALLDPVAGATSVAIPGLAGEIYRIEKRYFGPLIEGVDFNYLLTGGFELLGGSTFEAPGGDGDVYFIQFFAPGITASPDIIITVDGTEPTDPADGTTEYRNIALKDKPGRLVQRGFGANRQLYLPEIAIYPDGGFDLLGGKTFSSGDVYFWQPYPVICTTVESTSGGSGLSGEVIIDADTAYDIAHKNKVIVFRGADESLITYTLPDIETFPAFLPIRFEAANGEQIYGCIKTFGTDEMDAVLPNQVSPTKLYVAKGEHAVLMKGGTGGSWVWRVIEMPRGYDNLGEEALSSGIIRNAAKKEGQDVSKVNYARIWDWVQENESTVKVITEAEWDTETEVINPVTLAPFNIKLDCHKFADIDADTFRFPDDREFHYRIGNHTDGNTSEAVMDDNKAHDHEAFDVLTGKYYGKLVRTTTVGEVRTAGSADATTGEVDIITAKQMTRPGVAEVRVRAVNKISFIRY
jgi:hypothetical protein